MIAVKSKRNFIAWQWVESNGEAQQIKVEGETRRAAWARLIDLTFKHYKKVVKNE